MQQGEGTDPLRAALERIAALKAALERIANLAGWERPDAWFRGEAESIAREALASSPEPEWEYRTLWANDERTGELPTSEFESWHVRRAAELRELGWYASVERRIKAGPWEPRDEQDATREDAPIQHDRSDPMEVDRSDPVGGVAR